MKYSEKVGIAFNGIKALGSHLFPGASFFSAVATWSPADGLRDGSRGPCSSKFSLENQSIFIDMWFCSFSYKKSRFCGP